jgi:hypothetical protein
MMTTDIVALILADENVFEAAAIVVAGAEVIRVAYFPRVAFDLSSHFRVPTRGGLRLMV